MGLEWLLTLGLALADTGAPPPVPEEQPSLWSPGHAPPPTGDWPPRDLGAVTLPDDPTLRVRSPAPTLESITKVGWSVRTQYGWPTWAEKGYLPLRLSLAVPRDKDARIIATTLTSSYGSVQRSIRREDRLEPGERRDVDLLLPVFEVSLGIWEASFSAQDGDVYHIFGLGAPQWVSGTVHNALVVSDVVPPLGAMERWSASAPNVLVSFVSMGDLPEGASMAAAYTSLDVVALDISRGLPTPAQLAPLLAWVRLGGTLLLSGPDQPWPDELGRWMEDRFLLPGLLGEQAPAWSLGFGVVGRVPAGDWSDPVLAGALYTAAWQAPSFSMVPDPSDTVRSDALTATLGGIGTLPTGTIGFLLLVIAIAMGPVNLLMVRSLRRPVLLLLTTPVLAILSSSALVGWGLTRDGLGVKRASQSLVLLDQRARLASGVERRVTFAGGGQTRGLRPGAGTIILPGNARNPRAFDLDLRDGAEWTGEGMLPARQQVSHVILSDRETSRKLDLSTLPEGKGVEVQNHLGATVTALALRLPSGVAFATTAPIAEGASARLDPVSDPLNSGGFLGLRDQLPCVVARGGVLARYCRELLEGTYMAWVDGQPFRDDLGVEAKDMGGGTVVFGVLGEQP